MTIKTIARVRLSRPKIIKNKREILSFNMIQHHDKIDTYITVTEVDTSVWYIISLYVIYRETPLFLIFYPQNPTESPRNTPELRQISPRFRLVGASARLNSVGNTCHYHQV